MSCRQPSEIVVILKSKKLSPMEILDKLVGSKLSDVEITEYLTINFTGKTGTKKHALNFFINQVVKYDECVRK